VKLSDENRLLIWCARAGIPGDNPEDVASLLSLRIKWDELLNTAISQGIAPLVYRSLRDIPEKSLVPPDVMDSLKKAYHGNVARNMYLYSELERILTALNEKDIDVMALKGAALARTVYGDIGLRVMGDIDLLVKKECLPRVKEIMPALNYGAHRHSKPEEWYTANHFHLPPYVHNEKQIVVEIHWKVAQDSLGINVDKWWGSANETRLRDTRVLTPSPEDMILHLCVSMYHGNYNKAALRGLCDIAATVQYFSKEINRDRFHDIVSKCEIARPVYSLLFLVRKYFDGNNQLLPWLEAGHVDLKFSVILERIIFSTWNVSDSVFMRSLAAETNWEKAKMIFTGIFPSREKMSERYAVQSSSLKVYLYYAYRPFELLVNYGRSFLKMLCFRDSV